MTRIIPAVAAAVAATSIALPVHAEDGKVDIGINLTGVNYYSRELPFKDVFRGFQPFNVVQGSASFDTQGYPTQLSGKLRSIWDAPNVGTEKRYVILYDGQASLSLNGVNTISNNNGRLVFDFAQTTGLDPREKRRMWMEVNSMSSSNPLRNIRVIPASIESQFANGSTPANPFRQQFLDDWAPFQAGYRFMDWGGTNSSPVRTWDDRTRLGHATFSGERNNQNNATVPIEKMIELANTTGKDPWFCVPHQADDNYVRNMARVIRDNLDPSLTAKVEYSNEVWNWSFDQSNYAVQEGNKLPYSTITNDGEANWHWIGHRSNEIFNIFQDEFDDVAADQRPDLMRIAGTQKGNSRVTTRIMERTNRGQNLDAVAMAPYFGVVVRRQSNPDDQAYVATFKNWNWDQRVDHAWDEMYDVLERIYIHKREMARFNPNVKLVAYEGGQHWVTGGDWDQDSELKALFHELNRRPEMRDIYLAYLQEWERAGGEEFQMFASTGTFTGFGQWGLQEYMDAPLTDAPKLQGIYDYMNAGRIGQAPQQALLDEAFDSTNGWQRNGNITAKNVGGRQVVEMTGGQASITRDLDASNLTDVVVKLTAFQSNTRFEGMGRGNDDWLKIFVDYNDGNGWQLLLVDDAVWEAELDAASYDNSEFSIVSDHGKFGTTTPLSTGWLMLSDLADMNPDLKLRIETMTSASGEAYYLDALAVGGTVVPEPASLSLLGLGAAGLLRRRRA